MTKVIASVDVQEIRSGGEVIGNLKKILVWDKIKALELLGRHLGMFGDKQTDESKGGVIQDKPLTPEEWEKKYGQPKH